MTMVSEDNVAEICKVLISYALKSDPEFCNEILGYILLTCSRKFYEVIADFDWYVSLLGEMSRIPHCQKGEEIETQLIDIGNLFIHKVLSAAAWLSGEYVEFSRNPLELMESLLQPWTCLLPPPIRAVYIQSVFEVLTFFIYSFLSSGDDASYPSKLTDSFLKEDFQESSETVTSALIFDADLLNPRSSHQPTGNDEDLVIAHEKISPVSSKKQQLTQKSVMDLVNLVETNLGQVAGSHEVEIQERANNVLVSAPERVPVPDGLVLKESLSDIEAICNDIRLTVSSSFSLVRSHTVTNGTTIPEHPSKEEYEPSSESTSLLAEHRKRHELYYLPSENKEMIANDYPHAHKHNDQAIDEGDDLVKLTKESLDLRKKRNRAKPRPVGAVREVLLGNEAASSSNKASKKREKNEISIDRSSESNMTVTNTVASEPGNASSRRNNHHSDAKEKKRPSSRNEKKEHNHKDKRKNDHRLGKHKSSQRVDGTLNVVAQSPVIPYFLL
ncbi:AP-3 complex subunit delta [Olea europaea subsp. europaea]|uniref:AP-3 complex subunit delta n=1 Tax=Olea europaea subsp. europaea TaxID=158383 RepID=A0A8S0VII0_OLEEU|nr:AP-3 complex subunit delta [Olea europaea subsp. europaea]